MRNSHIKNLKEVVPIEVRLEVYRDVFKMLSKNSTWKGLKYELIMSLWDLNSIIDTCPDGTTWGVSEASTAFPELTQEKLNRLRTTKSKEDFSLNKMSILSEMVTEAQNLLCYKTATSGANPETAIEIVNSDSELGKKVFQQIGNYVNSEANEIGRSIDCLQNQVYKLSLIQILTIKGGINKIYKDLQKEPVYDEELELRLILANIYIEFEALCKAAKIPSISILEEIAENKF